MTIEIWLIAVLTFALWVVSRANIRLNNRIRRLEVMVGLDDTPPSELDRPHWRDEGARDTIDSRVKRIEGHLVL